MQYNDTQATQSIDEDNEISSRAPEQQLNGA